MCFYYYLSIGSKFIKKNETRSQPQNDIDGESRIGHISPVTKSLFTPFAKPILSILYTLLLDTYISRLNF